MSCSVHKHIVPVSRPPRPRDPDPDAPTMWRCLDCGDAGRWDPAEGLDVDQAAAS